MDNVKKIAKFETCEDDEDISYSSHEGRNSVKTEPNPPTPKKECINEVKKEKVVEDQPKSTKERSKKEHTYVEDFDSSSSSSSDSSSDSSSVLSFSSSSHSSSSSSSSSAKSRRKKNKDRHRKKREKKRRKKYGLT